ncbi:MAG TPA: WXG100 family type VII secretion target, partial [Anaerolineae bacterium]|nr:WXG100 family type VII secretion target [Anaerolineae bacterium]
MAEVIRVDYEALAKIAARFGQQSEAIEEMLQMVRGAMTPLQNGGWVGRGSDAFFAEMESDILPAVRRLADALSQASEVSRQIGDVLQGAEDEACSPFRVGDGGGAAGTGYGSGTAGGASGGNMYVPQNWLNNVGEFDLGGGSAANDWGIPNNWLDGVAGAMGIGGGGNNYGIPQDWLSGVTGALGSSGASDAGMAAGGAAGGAGSVGGAGGASDTAGEPPNMPSGGSGGGKEAAASDISSPYGRQTAASGSSTLFGGGKAVVEAQNGRLSYQSLGGAGFAPAAGGAPATGSSGGAGGAVPAR